MAPKKDKKRKKERVSSAVRFRRLLVTPEGVDLNVRIASASERAGAFLIDAIIIMLAMIVLTIGAALAAAGGMKLGSGPDVAVIIWVFGFFFLRNFYFFVFEFGPKAATPGKRLLHLRVASRSGGVLRADAIFARNAMREIEVFLPLTFLATSGDSVDGAIAIAGFVWCAVFVFLPLFNRDRLRAGDILANTWVVQAPRPALLPDLTAGRPPAALAAAQAFAFTQEQLDAYGIKELHVLEDVLRKNAPESLAAVARQIRAKIGWKAAPLESNRAFLEAYYSSLRQTLETKMLFGVRRADKFASGQGARD